ncbi:1-acyl-sn-glycerol-3-phosphate acyltransferase [Flammeovirgaceae bacterium 311]|nr:1-acyl-sn-glycerol-3-phosphate acyltransferase [Flammeovirgaceae bacterium 311]
MGKLLAHLLFWITGWKVEGQYPANVPKSVMIAAPHTSNWDFVYARAAFFIMGVPIRYTIKKEMMKFAPLGWLLKQLGAIPVERNRDRARKLGQSSLVQGMIDLFDQHDQLVIMVTPEGTRKFVNKWKTGFYYTALQAGVPIVLGYLDYEKKHAGIGPTVYPTGNLQDDMRKILGFYAGVSAKFPEQGVDPARMDMDYPEQGTAKAS